MRTRWIAVACIVVAGLAGLAGSGRAQDAFTNEEVGYKVRPPDGYKKAPGGFSSFGFSFGRDRYLLDTFENSRGIATKSGWDYKPRMYTLWFPARSAVEIKKAELEAEKAAKETAKEGEEPSVSFLVGGRVIQSFEEYAKDRITGFYFGEEKKQTIAEFPATLRPMIFEKLQNEPQRWLACSLEVPGGEFTILFSAPESHADKLRADFMNAFKSFKIVRDGGLVIPPLTSKVDVEKTPEIDRDTMSPEQIKQILAAEREKAFKKALDSMEKGWKSFETEHFLVLYETEQKYAKQAAQHAEDLRAWLETKFAGIGDGFEQSQILKVYKYDSSNTTNVSITIRSGSGPTVQVIHFRQPVSKGHEAEFSNLNTSVMSNWFSQKNEELYQRMPRWLGSGLDGFIDDAEKTGGKLRFEADEWERDRMIDGFNAQKKWEKEKVGEPPMKELRDLLKMAGKELWQGDSWTYTSAQCASVCRYLVEGPGSRGKYASVLRNYIKHLYDLVDEVEKRLEAEREERKKLSAAQDSMSDEEKLAAEDEAYKKKRKDALDNVEKEILEKAYALTFGDWTDADWRAFHNSWEQYAAGRTK